MAQWEIVGGSERFLLQEVDLQGQGFQVKVNTSGGFVSQVKYCGVDIVVNEHKNPKRIGIPRLGPVAGPVMSTPWEYLYPKMPQHGTDRNEPMTIMQKSHTGVVLSRTEGPRRFLGVWNTRMRVEIIDNHLMIAQSVTNLEEKPRERAVALHPYFKNYGEFQVVEPGSGKSDPIIGQATSHPKTYEVIYETGPIPENPGKVLAVKIDSSPNPSQFVRWTDSKDYQCWEPWWGEKGKGWIFGPGETITFKMRISANIYEPERS